MNKYLQSYIYYIKCNTTGLIYIGSSIEPMNTRLGKHLTDLRGYLGINGNKPRAYRSSFEVLMNDNYEMKKIEDYPCENKHQLEVREGLFIKNNNTCNKRLPCKLINKDLIEGNFSLNV